MSNTPLSIHQTTQLSQTEHLKDWIGRFVVSVMPDRAIDLYRKPTIETDSFTDKAIMFHLRRRAIAENRDGFLARFHKNFWSSKHGAEYSQNCDHRFEDLFLDLQQPDFRALQTVWESLMGRNIVEIGTNSGLLLEHLTRNLVQVTQSTGIDINADQIQRNQQSDKFDPRINFLCTDGRKWVLENGQSHSLFVSNGGVLEYFTREKLDEMLTHISTHCKPSVFFASEPIADDHDLENNTASIPFGEEHSFSHNYKDLFESNGFLVLHQRSVVYDSWKMQATIAISKA